MSIFRWTAPLFKLAARRFSDDDFRAMAEWLRPYVPAGGVFADLGGGTGEIGAGIARVLNARVIIVDPTPQMLRRVGADSAVSVRLAGVEALPFPDAYFDAALCCDSFHHFDDQDAAVREMARVIRPGGGLLILDAEPAGANRACARLERMLREPAGFMTTTDLEQFLCVRGIVGTAARQRGNSYAYVGSVSEDRGTA
jgi:ubiquinone/menaquinone biosynthesis C-methylase UbiE